MIQDYMQDKRQFLESQLGEYPPQQQQEEETKEVQPMKRQQYQQKVPKRPTNKTSYKSYGVTTPQATSSSTTPNSLHIQTQKLKQYTKTTLSTPKGANPPSTRSMKERKQAIPMVDTYATLLKHKRQTKPIINQKSSLQKPPQQDTAIPRQIQQDFLNVQCQLRGLPKDVSLQFKNTLTYKELSKSITRKPRSKSRADQRSRNLSQDIAISIEKTKQNKYSISFSQHLQIGSQKPTNVYKNQRHSPEPPEKRTYASSNKSHKHIPKKTTEPFSGGGIATNYLKRFHTAPRQRSSSLERTAKKVKPQYTEEVPTVKKEYQETISHESRDEEQSPLSQFCNHLVSEIPTGLNKTEDEVEQIEVQQEPELAEPPVDKEQSAETHPSIEQPPIIEELHLLEQPPVVSEEIVSDINEPPQTQPLSEPAEELQQASPQQEPEKALPQFLEVIAEEDETSLCDETEPQEMEHLEHESQEPESQEQEIAERESQEPDSLEPETVEPEQQNPKQQEPESLEQAVEKPAIQQPEAAPLSEQEQWKNYLDYYRQFQPKPPKVVSKKIQKIHEMLLAIDLFGGGGAVKKDPFVESDQADQLAIMLDRPELKKRPRTQRSIQNFDI